MATSSTTSPVTRITPAFARDKGSRQIMVTLTGGLIELRAKGLRSRETVDIGWLYQHAVKSRVWKDRMDKSKARKARKGLK